MSAPSPLIPVQIPAQQAHLSANQRFSLKMSGAGYLENPDNELAWAVQDSSGREWAVLDAKDIGQNRVIGLTIVETVQSDTSKSLQEKVHFLNQFIFGGIRQEPKMFMTEWFLRNSQALNGRLKLQKGYDPKTAKFIDEKLVDANVSRRAPAPPIPPPPKVALREVQKENSLIARTAAALAAKQAPAPVALKAENPGSSAVSALKAKFEQPKQAS